MQYFFIFQFYSIMDLDLYNEDCLRCVMKMHTTAESVFTLFKCHFIIIPLRFIQGLHLHFKNSPSSRV